MRNARYAVVLLMVVIWAGCGGPKGQLPGSAVQSPVQLSEESPKAGSEVIIEGRFIFSGARKLEFVAVQFKRPNPDGSATITQSGGAKVTPEGDDRYAYRVVLNAPLADGEHTLELFDVRDPSTMIATRKVVMRRGKEQK